MQTSIFEYPEMVAVIAEYLTPHEKLQFMLTSQAHRLQFEPYLFRHIVFHPVRLHRTVTLDHMDDKALAYLGDQGPFYQALTGNLHHIRVLELHDMTGDVLKQIVAMNQGAEAGDNGEAIGATATATMKGCTRLRRLEVFSEELFIPIYLGERRYDLKRRRKPFLDLGLDVLYLLRRNSSLTVLHLPSDMLQSPVMNRELLSVLKTGLPHLKALSFRKRIFRIPLQAALSLLRACLSLCSLEKLECHFDMKPSHDQGAEVSEEQAFEAIDWKSWQESSRTIRTLIMPTYLPLEIQTHVLRNCIPNLTKFRVHTPISLEFLAALEAHPTGIQHLLIEHNGRFRNIGPQSLSGILRVFESATRGDGLGGLKSLSLPYIESSDVVVGALLKHGGTLEDLSLAKSATITSLRAQQILIGCSQLTRLSMSMLLHKELSLVFQDLLQTPWVCTKLKFLRLNLSTPADTVVQQDCTHQMSGRIGDLEDLEELELDFKSSDIGQNRSDLSNLIVLPVLKAEVGRKQLRGLKKLRRLMISPDIWRSMGQEEVELLAREWLALEEVEFETNYKKLYWEAVELDHWRWLTRNRPGLQLTCRGAYSGA